MSEPHKNAAPVTVPVGKDGHAVPHYMLGHEACDHGHSRTMEIPESHPGHGKVVAPTTVAVGADGHAVPRYMQATVDHHSRTMEIPESHPVRTSHCRGARRAPRSRSRHLIAPFTRSRARVLIFSRPMCARLNTSFPLPRSSHARHSGHGQACRADDGRRGR